MNIRFFAFFIIILFLAGLSALISAPQGGVFALSGTIAPPISDETAPGSSAEGQTAAALSYERYDIPLGTPHGDTAQKFWTIDRDGNTIPEDLQFEVLYDALSGEPQCLMLTKSEIVGRNADMSPLTQDFSSLYDLDGNTLYGWDTYIYRAGFGDFVIRQYAVEGETHFPDIWIYNGGIGPSDEQYPPELWDFKRGRGVVTHAWQAERLSDEKVLLSDKADRPLAIVDELGRVLSQNTAEEYRFPRVANGCLIADFLPNGSNSGVVLLSPEFELLEKYDNLDADEAESFLLYENLVDMSKGGGLERSGIVTPEGKEIFQIPPGQRCHYFDDELMLLSSTAENDDSCKIVRIADGEVVCEFFSYVISYERDRREFFADYKDGIFYLRDRAGKIFAQRSIPDLDHVGDMDDKLISVITEQANGDNKERFFDTKLNEITPAGTYTSFSRADNWDGREPVDYDIFICSRSIGAGKGEQEAFLYDIVDFSGNVLISGLNEVYATGPDRLAVRKGFDVGLMDWSGEWIVKRSIFSELWD